LYLNSRPRLQQQLTLYMPATVYDHRPFQHANAHLYGGPGIPLRSAVMSPFFLGTASGVCMCVCARLCALTCVCVFVRVFGSIRVRCVCVLQRAFLRLSMRIKDKYYSNKAAAACVHLEEYCCTHSTAALSSTYIFGTRKHLQNPPSCARLAVSCPLIRIRKQCKSNSEAHLTQNTQQLASHARRVFSTSVCTRNRLGHRAHVVQGTAGGDGGGGQVHVLCIAKTHMRQWQQQCELLWTGLTVCGCEECVLCLANKYTHSISSGVSYCGQKEIGCAGQQDPWTQVDCYNRPGHAPSYALYMTVCIVNL